jgi:L-threonylcarbamoyladenylate synthase
MIILDYEKQHHKKIIDACVLALKRGKSVVYPTDTSYGLAVDAGNVMAIKKLYQIKGRNFNKPVHVVVPSLAYAKRIARWNKAAEKLAKKFWPGQLTLVLPIVGAELARPSLISGGQGQPLQKAIHRLSANTGSIGLRMPDNLIAMDLAKHLKLPITATSANVSGRADCYSAAEIIAQFQTQKYKPDIIINAGKLPKRKPSTLVRIFDDVIKVLREGPVSEKQIISLLNTKEYEKY